MSCKLNCLANNYLKYKPKCITLDFLVFEITQKVVRHIRNPNASDFEDLSCPALSAARFSEGHSMFTDPDLLNYFVLGL